MMNKKTTLENSLDAVEDRIVELEKAIFSSVSRAGRPPQTRKHWGSVNDLTAEGILAEDESSEESEEEEGSGDDRDDVNDAARGGLSIDGKEAEDEDEGRGELTTGEEDNGTTTDGEEFDERSSAASSISSFRQSHHGRRNQRRQQPPSSAEIISPQFSPAPSATGTPSSSSVVVVTPVLDNPQASSQDPQSREPPKKLNSEGFTSSAEAMPATDDHVGVILKELATAEPTPVVVVETAATTAAAGRVPPPPYRKSSSSPKSGKTLASSSSSSSTSRHHHHHHHHHHVRRTRTKIICAIGPACRSKEMLYQLLEAGMSVARLNFSHGDHAYHAESLRNLRAAVEERRNRGFYCNCAVLMDTKGPEIRTGKLEGGKPIELKTDQLVWLTSRDYDAEPGSLERGIKISYDHLCEDLKPGDTILIADGELSLTVVEVRREEGSLMARVENDFTLGERKNVNLPGISIRIDSVTDKDRYDIANFALVHNVDIVSGSFCRSAANVRALRECLQGRRIRVHAKIESVEALRNLDEIIREADGIHVSRGDLGMELPLAKLAVVQKAIIHACNVAGKPVVTSTQTLQSMVNHPRPTNAECTDVANAVLDGTDCIMLSGETANGLFPIQSCQFLAKIITQAERLLNFEYNYMVTRDLTLGQMGKMSVIEAICSSAVETAIELKSRLIVCSSDTGRMGVFLSKYRPRARILLVTLSPQVANQMCVSRDVEAVVAPSIENLDVVWEFVVRNYLSRESSPWRLPVDHPVILCDTPPSSYDSMGELAKQRDISGVARWSMVKVMRVPPPLAHSRGGLSTAPGTTTMPPPPIEKISL